MQTLLSTLIVIVAALYIAKQWLPHKVKQHFMQLVGKSPAKQPAPSTSACGSCSSCGNCGSNAAKSTKKVIITLSK